MFARQRQASRGMAGLRYSCTGKLSFLARKYYIDRVLLWLTCAAVLLTKLQRMTDRNIAIEQGKRTHSRPDILLNLAPGLITGITTVISAVSLSALIFSGPLLPYIDQGVAIALTTAIVMTLLFTLSRADRIAVATPQDRTAPILAILAASLVASAPQSYSDEQTIQLVILGILATSMITGITLYLIGLSKAGGLMRFVPFSVIAGFFAGTGWLLTIGSLQVMLPTPLTSELLADEWFTQENLSRWAPGILLALVMQVSSLLARPVIALIAVLLMGVLLFYALTLIYGDLHYLESHGWLLGPFDAESQVKAFPLQIEHLTNIEFWTLLQTQWSSIATVVLISAFSILLSVSALELLNQKDLDINKELKLAGLGNMTGGMLGGMVGFHSLSISSLAIRLGNNSRVINAVALMVCIATFASGALWLGLIPRFVLGALLLSMGISFLSHWVIASRKTLPRSEYFVVLLILFVIAVAGLVDGIVIGLLAAVIMFVLNYSRTDVVLQNLDGSRVLSSVERAPEVENLLKKRGGGTWILRLRGYLFFGTATKLYDQIRLKVSEQQSSIHYLVFDFKQVIGMDASAAQIFSRLIDYAEQHSVRIVFADLPPLVKDQLQQAATRKTLIHEHQFVDLDHALEWCESQYLNAVNGETLRNYPSFFQRLTERSDNADLDTFKRYLSQHYYSAKQTIIEFGDARRDLVFVGKGEVSVFMRNPSGRLIRIRRTSSGTALGEISFYQGTPRSASVVADSDVTIYRLSRESLSRMEVTHPQYAIELHHYLAELLAERLLHSSVTLSALIE